MLAAPPHELQQQVRAGEGCSLNRHLQRPKADLRIVNRPSANPMYLSKLRFSTSGLYRRATSALDPYAMSNCKDCLKLQVPSKVKLKDCLTLLTLTQLQLVLLYWRLRSP